MMAEDRDALQLRVGSPGNTPVLELAIVVEFAMHQSFESPR